LLEALCGVFVDQTTEQLDEFIGLLAHGAHPAAAAVYARAVRREGLATLIERFVPEDVPLADSILAAPPSVDGFFEDIFEGRLAGVICAMAAGMDVHANGPRIFDGDLGCCQWSPLAAAAEISGRRSSGPIMVNMLLLAKADCKRLCTGPCGLTPLMHAARGGSTAACALLVRAGADVRARHAVNGNTALEMGTKATERAIRAERDTRAASAASASTDMPKIQAKERARGSKGHMTPNLAALAFAQVGKGKIERRAR
jgi:hypothetical protein